MTARKKPADKEAARQLRAELFASIDRGELTIQDAVKRMRKVSRLTQPEFAAHRGLSVKVIKELERGVGNPTVNTLNQIGQFFGLEVAFVRSARLHGRDDNAPIDDARRLMEELESIKQLIIDSAGKMPQ